MRRARAESVAELSSVVQNNPRRGGARRSEFVPDRTTIDGGELFTFERENDLDADGRRGVMFYVGTGTTAELIGVTLVGQHFVVGVLNEGELTVRRTITRSLGVGFINTATGSLVIRHSAVLEEDSKCGLGEISLFRIVTAVSVASARPSRTSG
jgi:hypothetical protein